MMYTPLEVPQVEDLEDFGVDIVQMEQPGVVALTAMANDGDSVTLTWDEMARSTHVRWMDSGTERFALERETATKISVRHESGAVQFRVWSQSEGLRGELVVTVGDRVSISDALLQA